MKKYLKKIFKQKEQKSKFLQQQDRFLKKYPNYEIGSGSYGIPIVHDWHEGTTLVIGNYCSIANNVQILLGGHHRTDWVSTYPFPAYVPQASHIKNYGGTNGDVIIGSDVWLCANCIILSGVTIGHGSVITNGAVVTKDVEPYSIVGGNPAKHIKYRFEEKIRADLLKTQWWNWPTEEIHSITDIFCSDDIQNFLEYARSRKV